MQNESPDWILTDDDSRQHVKLVGEFAYSLIEMCLIARNPDLFEVYADTINLQDDFDVTSSEVSNILFGYGYIGYYGVVSQYGFDAPQVVAECIFEHYGSSRVGALFTGSEAECIEYIDQYINQ